MILNSEDTDVGVINKEDAEGGNNIRIDSYNGMEEKHCYIRYTWHSHDTYF